MASAATILSALTALKNPNMTDKSQKIAAIKAVALVLTEASGNGMILSLINPTDDELNEVRQEAEAALKLVNEHKDELTDEQLDSILENLRSIYRKADERAMSGLTGNVAKKPEVNTFNEAVHATDEPEEPEFNPETDLELQGDPTEQPAEDDEDPIVKFAKNLKEKAPVVVDLLKTIFG